MTLRAALIGAGQISRQHLSCLAQLEGVRTVAICDRSRSVAEMMAERYGVDAWYDDARDMLRAVQPDVVHITTPASSHDALAREAVCARAHVIVEKPATTAFSATLDLLRCAEEQGRFVVENLNYVFNTAVADMRRDIAEGRFGRVLHVSVTLSVDIFGPESVFADAHVSHGSRALDTGAIGDFLPHLASLAHAFIGPHRSVATSWRKLSADHAEPADDFTALVVADDGATASLRFTAHGQPDSFTVIVEGTRQRTTTNLFEPGLTTERLRPGVKPLTFTLNSLASARALRRSALRSVARKIGGGPGPYDGLWSLIGLTYAAISGGGCPPVSHQTIRDVGRLVRDIGSVENRM